MENYHGTINHILNFKNEMLKFIETNESGRIKHQTSEKNNKLLCNRRNVLFGG